MGLEDPTLSEYPVLATVAHGWVISRVDNHWVRLYTGSALEGSTMFNGHGSRAMVPWVPQVIAGMLDGDYPSQMSPSPEW